METTRLGSTGPAVSRIGLGCMAMSGGHGPTDRAESVAAIQAALAAGVTLLDTADFYGMGDNELLIAEALRGVDADQALISVKFGAQRGPDGGWLGYDARPAAVKTALAYSLKRLNRDHIDIYRPARLDRQVPIEETVGAIAEMVDAGYVRHIGLSEVGADTLRRAAAVHPICDLQIEYSLLSRGIEHGILPACRELGVSVTAYGVLSHGLIGGSYSATARAAGDMRGQLPRFEETNLGHNLKLVERLSEIAEAKGATIAQLAIAWVLARGEEIVPVIGARSRRHIQDALGAIELALDRDELQQIAQALPAEAVAGERHGAAQMADLDSER